MTQKRFAAVARAEAAHVLYRTAAALTHGGVTEAWIQPLMWLRRLSPAYRTSSVNQRFKVLILRLDGIGDLVMTGPFLRELRRAFPDAHITLVVGPHAVQLVEACPYVDRVVGFRLPPVTRWWHPLSRRLRALSFARAHLWSERYDLAVIPRWGEDIYEAAVLAFLSGARRRVGYSERGPKERGQHRGYDRFLTDAIDDWSIKHEVQRNLDLLPPLGAHVLRSDMEIWLADEDQRVATDILASRASDKLVAFGPGAGHARREWPAERFGQVGRWLADQGFQLVVVGGPGEEGIGKELSKHVGPGLIDLTNKATLRQTAAVLSRCALFCGNDAGPMHLAAAVGVPVVEVSCHSLRGDDLHTNSPKRFGPWGVPKRIVRPEEPVDGCAAGCREGTPHCILNVRVDSVIDALESLMSETAVIGGPVDAS